MRFVKTNLNMAMILLPMYFTEQKYSKFDQKFIHNMLISI